ncbi:calmodulin-binding protein 25-like [Ananas comosus]|uniref:Calmodulin-binding protein 25 n=1 Tax=Ananas comosus TaxID=4615 RepID=A0A199V7M2_ANACO|nr:calmodulin-binding protein 25-like [Ananas comosus]OAY73013.1 Calmodulin-binding protein 25 [Ananas comosus]
MASGSSLDPWLSPLLAPEAALISDYAFARDNEALAGALRISPSPDSASAGPELAFPAPAGADPRGSNPVRLAPAGRIRKRKRRASRRSPTTYISADPANFREMVQLVTGIRFEPGSAVEPDRAGFEQSLLLPALDSSAFSQPDRAGTDRPVAVDVSLGPGSIEGPVYGFDPTPCFPTLESWSV